MESATTIRGETPCRLDTAKAARSAPRAQLMPRWMSSAAGRSAAWYCTHGIHLITSSKVRPGSTA